LKCNESGSGRALAHSFPDTGRAEIERIPSAAIATEVFDGWNPCKPAGGGSVVEVEKRGWFDDEMGEAAGKEIFGANEFRAAGRWHTRAR